MADETAPSSGATPGGQRPGLRERKKRRTRETIAEAALELFDRQGYHATTIAQIAEAADVAPRTVSAYFPVKEELVFPHSAEWLGRLEARLRDRPADETAPEALRAWIEAQLPEWQTRERELSIQRRLVASDESLRMYRRNGSADLQELLAEGIARDLGSSPHALVPRMAAAATAAILDLLDEDHGRPAEESVAARHAEAMRLFDCVTLFISGGIGAVRADPLDRQP